MLRAVHRWLPLRKKIAREAHAAFATTGCSQLEWGVQAHRIFSAAGFDPATQPFCLCFDAAKVVGKLTWDQRAGRWVGQLDFDSNLGFDSWDDMQAFITSKVAAGYALVFLLCPLSPCIPSLYVPVGLLPTDLTYTSVDLHRWVGEIFAGLTSAGFGHVLPAVSGDNAGPHCRFFKLCGNVRGGDRELGGSIGHELLEASDEHAAIFSLGAFKHVGTSCETAALTDPTHDF